MIADLSWLLQWSFMATVGDEKNNLYFTLWDTFLNIQIKLKICVCWCQLF